MKEEMVFSFERHNIRTVVKDGYPWFVAKDICEVLEIKNPTQAVGQLDDDERAMFNIGRQGDTNIVNEPGLYSLILRRPQAWLRNDVEVVAHPATKAAESFFTRKRIWLNLCTVSGKGRKPKVEDSHIKKTSKKLGDDKEGVITNDPFLWS